MSGILLLALVYWQGRPDVAGLGSSRCRTHGSRAQRRHHDRRMVRLRPPLALAAGEERESRCRHLLPVAGGGDLRIHPPLRRPGMPTCRRGPCSARSWPGTSGVRIIPASGNSSPPRRPASPRTLRLADRAKSRSKQNTFIVVPVVFIMLSSHFPVTTYGSQYNWLVLDVLVLVGWAVASVIRSR